MAINWNTGYSSWWIYSNGNKTVKRNNLAAIYRNLSSNMKYAVGKYYIEVKVEDAVSQFHTAVCVGRNFTFVSPTSAMGSDTEEWAFKANGDLINGGVVNSGWGSSYGVGDTIGIAYEVTTQGANTGKVWFAINGVWQGGGNPATGANPAYSNLYGWGIYILCYCGYYVGSKFTIISDYQSQTYSVPSGFTDWDGAAPPAWTELNFTSGIIAGSDVAVSGQTYEETILASILTGDNFERALTREETILASILTGDSFAKVYETFVSIDGGVKAGFKNLESFDYTAWLKTQKPLSTLKYYLTLRENRGDEGEDVPLINFEMIIRGENYSHVSATFGYDSIDALLQNSNFMEISFVYYIAGVENLRVKLFEGEVERINFDQYKTISLTSWFRFHKKESGQNYSVSKISINKADGTYRIKVVDPDPFMRPGDTITDEENDTYTIEVINLIYGPGYFISEIISNG